MAAHLQLLGTGSADSRLAPSALLFFDQTRYLFGAGEGTQRVCTEGHVRMSKMRHVFLTRIHQDQVGGLTGLLITLADLGLKQVGVHGPGPVPHFLQASRNVSIRSNLKIDCYQAGASSSAPASNTAASSPSSVSPSAHPQKHFEDVNISVDVVVLAEHEVRLPPLRTIGDQRRNVKPQAATDAVASSNGHGKRIAEPVDASIDDTPMEVTADACATDAAAAHSNCKRPKHVHPPANQASSPTAASSPADSPVGPPKLSYVSVDQAREIARASTEWVTETHPALVAYIVSLASIPGKFDIAKAKALGIPPGPLYSKLKAGESITLRKSELGGAPKKKAKQPAKKGDAPPAVENSAPEPASADDPLLTFHPSDCVAAPTPGPQFAVVDCPNRAFVERVVTHPAFKAYQQPTSASTTTAASSASKPPLMVILHLAPMSVLSDPAYQAWMSAFGPSTSHILLNASTSIMRPVFRCAALNHIKMRAYVSDKLFPGVLAAQLDAAAEAQPESNALEVRAALAAFPVDLQTRLIGGESMLRFQLHGGRKDIAGRDASQVLPAIKQADLQASLEEHSNAEGLVKLEQWRAAMKEGLAAGKTVLEIAESVKQQQAAAAAAVTAESAEEKSSDVPMGETLVEMDVPLRDPVPQADFTPEADTLGALGRESDVRSPHLLFLGTGSAIPSKYRNVTGQFFHPGYEALPSAEEPSHPIGGFFFDCGEGSYGQLCLRYSGAAGGPAAAHRLVHDLIADLKCVWISHIHADHHLGLLSILAAYQQTWMARYKTAHGGDQTDLSQMILTSPASFPVDGLAHHHVPKLLVVGPRRLYFWLKEYAACAYQVGEEDQFRADGRSTSTTAERTLFDWIEFTTCSELQDRTSHLTAYLASNAPALAQRYPHVRPRCFSVFQTVQVRHCADAYGLVIETPAGVHPRYKLVISGDTQPCQALVDAGVDATLLIHEATLEDDMIAEAREKRHSTTRQAIEVGLRMNARRILLTHFSQRYPKIPSFSDHFSERTCLAFDLMSIRFNQLAWLPALTPAYGWMFDETKQRQYEKQEATAGEE